MLPNVWFLYCTCTCFLREPLYAGDSDSPWLVEAFIPSSLTCPLLKQHSGGYSKSFAFQIYFTSASFKMVGPNSLEEQSVYLLEADLGLLKFTLTLAKPQYERRVSRKRASIPANPTWAFSSKLNCSVYKAVSRHLILNGNVIWKWYHLLENFKNGRLIFSLQGEGRLATTKAD